MAKWFSNINRELFRMRLQAHNLRNLFRYDLVSFRYWVVHIPVMDQHLSKKIRVLTTNLLTDIAQRNPKVSREIVEILPEQLAKVTLETRHRSISLLQFAAAENVLVIPSLLKHLPKIISTYDDTQLQSYIMVALELYSKSSEALEAFLRGDSSSSQQITQKIAGGLSFPQVEKSMTFYARAHCGETVEVRSGGRSAFTDGRHIYLPERIDEEPVVARQMYQVLTARNAGYIEFGTMDLDLHCISGKWLDAKEDELEIERMLRSFPNSALARELFFLLENFRVEQCLRREYPGVAAIMDGLTNQWRKQKKLRESSSDVDKVLHCFQNHLWNKTIDYQLKPRLQKVLQKSIALTDELSHSQSLVQNTVEVLLLLYDEYYSLMRFTEENDMLRMRGASPFGQQNESSSLDGNGSLKLESLSKKDRKEEVLAKNLQQQELKNGKELSLQKARQRVKMNFKEVSDFMDRMPGPSGPIREDGKLDDSQKVEQNIPKKLLEQVEKLPDTWLYPEWDFKIEDTKPNWTQVHEFRVESTSLQFCSEVLSQYSTQIKQLRRVFEALRPDETRRYRGVDDGDELDFERLIEARISQRTGGSSSSNFYSRKIRRNRDTAVAFLLDMSSSTNELANEESKRIIDVEKEALVVISEAVEAIGDRFAVYGFSGYGRDQVAFYIAKDIDEHWNDNTRARVGEMSWKMENRDGAAIRHCTAKMSTWSERNRVLILLSDGKPLDCGCPQYSDDYAQQDTKMALKNAIKNGIQPFCITVDPYGQDYLQEMYGKAGYIVIDRIDRLPSVISKVYRRLTV